MVYLIIMLWMSIGLFANVAYDIKEKRDTELWTIPFSMFLGICFVIVVLIVIVTEKGIMGYSILKYKKGEK